MGNVITITESQKYSRQEQYYFHIIFGYMFCKTTPSETLPKVRCIKYCTVVITYSCQKFSDCSLIILYCVQLLDLCVFINLICISLRAMSAYF